MQQNPPELSYYYQQTNDLYTLPPAQIHPSHTAIPTYYPNFISEQQGNEISLYGQPRDIKAVSGPIDYSHRALPDSDNEPTILDLSTNNQGTEIEWSKHMTITEPNHQVAPLELPEEQKDTRSLPNEDTKTVDAERTWSLQEMIEYDNDDLDMGDIRQIFNIDHEKRFSEQNERESLASGDHISLPNVSSFLNGISI